MVTTIETLRPHLLAFDIRRLFVEGLGWDHYQAQPVIVSANNQEYSLKPVAEKSGFAVYVCNPDRDGTLPAYPVRRKIENSISKLAFEHLIVFVDADRTTQTWQWVKREKGQPPAYREQAFHAGQSGEAVLQRLQEVAFTLEDEAKEISISDVAMRVYKAFDVEKLTKRFFNQFKKELTVFGDFIEGITAQGDREWYASLMLNRMMFVYFIQKRSFLDGDTDYLRNRLHMVQQRSGGARFQQFYRLFLLRLFHEGLGQPESHRAPDLAELIGDVPFLNGGLFDVHELERDNPNINIPDEAFERVFSFFDGYRWHLDERPYRVDKEINPDVLGYIFEKFVNQKQMGAYYTKEDITGYITRNAVIPFLFDTARKACPVAFGRDGGVWRLLQDDPDRYIYPTVGHGIAWNARQVGSPERLDTPFQLPKEIAAGIDDVSKRDGWNRDAPDRYALPTESWREVSARRARYTQVRQKLESGKVLQINDLITLNLDVERFARDVISQSEGPELLRAFWHAMRDVSVLDPTCGSGAFLFAALNVLEPLYTACLEGMRGFLDDLERTGRRLPPDSMRDFRDLLEQVDRHPSERYFILKSIVLNNLYGVDIMEEAVEICKLRLFLKLVAQLKSYDEIEPLPDIDFNIRAGNTLVGFTSLDALRQAMTVTPDGQHRQVFPENQAALDRIENEAAIASAAFNQFRQQQTILDGDVASTEKASLRNKLGKLSIELDRYLATEYGVNVQDSKAYEAWRDSHKPFHWFVEFYGITNKGGFDIIIGNPPYKDLRTVTEYQVHSLSSIVTKNLYPLVMERCIEFSQPIGRLGIIVPVSSISTTGYKALQEIIFQHSGHFSSFDDRPSRLFDGLQHIQLTIHLIQRQLIASPILHVTECYRWNAAERNYLFDRLTYQRVERGYLIGCLPKISRAIEHSMLQKVWKDKRTLGQQEDVGDFVTYYSRKVHNFLQALDFVPEVYNGQGELRPPTELKKLVFKSPEHAALAFCILNSSLFRWYINVFSDCRHVNKREVNGFHIDFDDILLHKETRWIQLADKLSQRLTSTSEFRNMRFKHDHLRVQCIIPKFSKSIIDEIDRELAEHYSFTDDELDFIINYDIKYRMGLSGS